jgi:hypothetical protein
MCPFATALFHTTAFPRQPEYFIPVGNRQVLISLATHFDNHRIAEMAIAKVVERIPDGSAQTACILSLQHAIILEIDKSCQPTKVKRTKILRILDDDGGEKGARALIATLSAYSNLSLHISTSTRLLNAPSFPSKLRNRFSDTWRSDIPRRFHILLLLASNSLPLSLKMSFGFQAVPFSHTQNDLVVTQLVTGPPTFFLAFLGLTTRFVNEACFM